MDPASDVLFGNWILNQYGNAFYLTFVHFTPSSLELFSLPQLVAFYLHTGYPELPYLQIICFLQELLFLCHVPFHPLCCSGWCRDAGIIICCDIIAISVGDILARIELKDPIPQYMLKLPLKWGRGKRTQIRWPWVIVLRGDLPGKLDPLSVSGIPTERLKIPTKSRKTTESRWHWIFQQNFKLSTCDVEFGICINKLGGKLIWLCWRC